MRPLLEKVLEALRGSKKSVATAESCTGGLLAARLTDLSGSSDVYVGGVCAYSNGAKITLLNVPESLIAAHGAVSREVALAMARGVQSVLRADFALSLTGIAGPGGGSEEKPVGTVWCGLATPTAVEAVCWQLQGDRAEIRDQATRRALEWLLAECQLNGMQPPK